MSRKKRFLQGPAGVIILFGMMVAIHLWLTNLEVLALQLDIDAPTLSSQQDPGSEMRSPSHRPPSRRLAFESLETRRVLSADLAMPPSHLDINDDGLISPVDALAVINRLNADETNGLACDVNGDGACSPIDAILVINLLNAQQDGTVLELSPTDADFNTRLIESHVQLGLSVVIPEGAWPVRPISMGPQSSLRGVGKDLSELRLELDTAPGRSDPQHVIGVVAPKTAGGFVSNIRVSDLTINANFANIDWSQVYNDGNGHGLRLHAVEKSTFERLEIKNARTDGIYIATVLGFENNSRELKFDDITIHHAGRQGVSIVGGEKITLTRFTVTDIGRDANLHISPRSAIDLEPEPNAKRWVRDITIRDWTIRRVGQGILATGTGSSKPMENIVIKDISIVDLDGPQVLAVREVKNLQVNNVVSREHHSATGGLSVFFGDTEGDVYGLKIRDITGVNYPIQIRGDSDIRLQNIVVSDTHRGILQIGGAPSQASENTKVTLTSFAFTDSSQLATPYVPIRVNSAATVTMRNGEMLGIGNSLFTMELTTDVTCHNCDFAEGTVKYFYGQANGNALGNGNSWQE